MRYRTFPATGDEISVLGFGAMGFAGWFGAVDDRDSPCTPPSTWRQPDRHGTRLRAFRARRRQGARSWSGPAPFVATKIKPVGPRTQFAIPLPVDEAFPKGWVTESAETSLRELGRDHVDLMQLQLYWPTWGHEGYWMEELQALKQAGKARAGGLGARPLPRPDTPVPGELNIARRGSSDGRQGDPENDEGCDGQSRCDITDVPVTPGQDFLDADRAGEGNHQPDRGLVWGDGHRDHHRSARADAGEPVARTFGDARSVGFPACGRDRPQPVAAKQQMAFPSRRLPASCRGEPGRQCPQAGGFRAKRPDRGGHDNARRRPHREVGGREQHRSSLAPTPFSVEGDEPGLYQRGRQHHRRRHDDPQSRGLQESRCSAVGFHPVMSHVRMRGQRYCGRCVIADNNHPRQQRHPGERQFRMRPPGSSPRRPTLNRWSGQRGRCH